MVHIVQAAEAEPPGLEAAEYRHGMGAPWTFSRTYAGDHVVRRPVGNKTVVFNMAIDL